MSAADLLGARTLRELCRRHGIEPRKSLGQNFVIDPNTIRKVIEVAGVAPEDDVLEIGAGAGSLTVGLARTAHHVTAVEVDRRLEPLLVELLGESPNVDVSFADARHLPWVDLKTTKLVANLPYNIAITLVLDALEHGRSLERLAVMTQREAGERLAAAPGSKSYGATSVLAQFFADVEVAARISRNAFWPVPNVDSVVVVLRRRLEPADLEVSKLKTVVNAAFGQRRKMLRNALGSITPEPDRLLGHVGLDPSVRAEDVSVEGFVALARTL